MRPVPPPTVSSSSWSHSRPIRPALEEAAVAEAVAVVVGAAGGGGGGGGGGGNGDGIPATAQLKMLKSLQKEINDRTEALDELRRRNKQLSPEQTAELQRLA